uniref:SSD domain-containing protein n=1 Tax=Angiostrongylus costaricensis TaxID=334426 RepID=A0A158PH62_ANGCS
MNNFYICCFSEARKYLEFYNLTVFPRRAFVIFLAKDGGDILRLDHLDEVIRFDSLITAALADRTPSEQGSCDPLCDLNRPFHLITKELRSNNSGTDNKLGYPESSFRGTTVFIGMHFFGASVVPGTNKLRAKSIILWYFSRVDTPERKQTYKDTTLNLFRVSTEGSFSNLIDFHIFGDEIANSEMVRGALEKVKKISPIGGDISDVNRLHISACLCDCRDLEANYITRHSILRLVNSLYGCTMFFLSTVLRRLVAITLITPFLATVAAFGLLSWMQYPIYSMQCVTPFLVLGIGVDDSFILIHRWKHRSDIPDHSLRLTKMSLFCLSTSVALFIDYIVTYTVLAPVVYICSDIGGYQVALSTKPSKSDFLGKCNVVELTLKRRRLIQPFMESLGANGKC